MPFPGRTIGEAIDFLKGAARQKLPEGFSYDFQGESRQYVQEGSTLVITIVISALIGSVLCSFLVLISARNQGAMRALAWKWYRRLRLKGEKDPDEMTDAGDWTIRERGGPRRPVPRTAQNEVVWKQIADDIVKKRLSDLAPDKKASKTTCNDGGCSRCTPPEFLRWSFSTATAGRWR